MISCTISLVIFVFVFLFIFLLSTNNRATAEMKGGGVRLSMGYDRGDRDGLSKYHNDGQSDKRALAPKLNQK
jgi:hypothetical protein